MLQSIKHPKLWITKALKVHTPGTALLTLRTFHYVFMRALKQYKEPYLFSTLLVSE